jgi:hypothetical protein
LFRAYVKIEEIENLLGVLMQGANYCDDGYIAGVRTLQTLFVVFANLKRLYVGFFNYSLPVTPPVS